MSWRVLFMQNPGKLSIRNANILLERRDQEDMRIAIGDISVIVVEHPALLMTSAFLAACAAHSIALISCDGRSMPCGVFHSFGMHSRFAKHARMQSHWSAAFMHRAWQGIVKAKIGNQATLVERVTGTRHPALSRLVATVQSGDKDNREAVAARMYWAALFETFRRGDEDDFRNSVLNYGYAVLRSVVARSLSAQGFVAAFGLHHKSELNAFNLADDLLEAFRPFVDEKVFALHAQRPPQEDASLRSEDKKELVAILHKEIRVGEESTNILGAIHTAASSLLAATEAKDPRLLVLPSFAQAGSSS